MNRFVLAVVLSVAIAGCNCGGPGRTDAGPEDAGPADSGPQNRSPTAADDTAQTAQGVSLLIDVLANDADPDGDQLALASVAAAANGTTAVEGRQVRYTPAAGFSGGDAFTYVASDGRGGTAQGSVQVTVVRTPAPLAVAPAIGPGGDLVVFGLDGGVRVLVSRADAGATATLYAPRWSPDGGELAFLGGDHAWVARSDGSQARMLDEPITPTSPWQGFPRNLRWSPDGTRLAVVGLEVVTDNDAVFVVRVDGTSGYELAVLADDAFWTPGADALLWAEPDPGRGSWVTYRHPLDGGAEAELALGEVVAVSKAGDFVTSRRQLFADGGLETDLWLHQGAGAARQLSSELLFIGGAPGDEVEFNAAGDTLAVRASVLDTGGNTTGRQVARIIGLDGGLASLYDSLDAGSPDVPQCLRWLPGSALLSYQLPDEGPSRIVVTSDGDGGLLLSPGIRGGYPQLICHDWRMD